MKLKTVITTVFKGLAIVLTLAVLLPSALKLSHSLNHHKHQTCGEDTKHTTHFHQTNIDCDFYKFKLSENHFFNCHNFTEQFEIVSLEVNTHYYVSFHNNQQLTRFLRGPPQLV